MSDTRKIAVVASNGRNGQLIVQEAVKRGFDVTGFARSANKSVSQHFVQKDIMDLTAEDLADFEAVVDAFGAWTPETLPLHTTTSQHLADILSGTDTRLLIVGGAAGWVPLQPEVPVCKGHLPQAVPEARGNRRRRVPQGRLLEVHRCMEGGLA